MFSRDTACRTATLDALNGSDAANFTPAYMDFSRDALEDRFQRYGEEVPRAQWFMQFDVADNPLAAYFSAVLDAIGAVPLHTRRIIEWGNLLVSGGVVAPGTSFDRLQLTDTCIPVRPCSLNKSEEDGWVAPDSRTRDIKVRLDRHPKSGTVNVRLRSPVVSPRAGWVATCMLFTPPCACPPSPPFASSLAHHLHAI
jgi:hypothetical protein